MAIINRYPQIDTLTTHAMTLDIKFVETLVFVVEVWASQPQQIPTRNVYSTARIKIHVASKSLSDASSSRMPATSASRMTGTVPINALMAPALTARSRFCLRRRSASQARSSSESVMLGYDYQTGKTNLAIRTIPCHQSICRCSFARKMNRTWQRGFTINHL